MHSNVNPSVILSLYFRSEDCVYNRRMLKQIRSQHYKKDSTIDSSIDKKHWHASEMLLFEVTPAVGLDRVLAWECRIAINLMPKLIKSPEDRTVFACERGNSEKLFTALHYCRFALEASRDFEDYGVPNSDICPWSDFISFGPKQRHILVWYEGLCVSLLCVAKQSTQIPRCQSRELSQLNYVNEQKLLLTVITSQNRHLHEGNIPKKAIRAMKKQSTAIHSSGMDNFQLSCCMRALLAKTVAAQLPITIVVSASYPPW